MIIKYVGVFSVSPKCGRFTGSEGVTLGCECNRDVTPIIIAAA